MNQKLLFLFLTAICISCTQPKPILEKIAIARIEAMNQHNLEALSALYAADAQIQSVGFEKVEIGPAGIKGVYTRYLASSPDLTYKITDLTASDSSVVVEYTSSGTMRQSPLEETVPGYMVGKTYTLKNCTRMDIQGNKIIREMTYFDQVSFLRQMGFFDQKN